MYELPAFIMPDHHTALNFALSGYKVISLIDEEVVSDALDNVPNVSHASILLPQYEAIALELDGRYDEARFMYHNWLSSKECMEYLNLMALGLMQGISIGVFFGNPEDIDGMAFPRFFLEYFYNIFGIIFSNNNGATYGSIRPEFISINLGRFLLQGLVDIPLYYSMMPDNMDLTPEAIMYLNSVLRPPLKREASEMEYNEYFKNLIKKSRKAGRYLRDPIVRPENGL